MRKFPGRRINNFRNIYLILRPHPIRKFAGRRRQSENSLGAANQKIRWEEEEPIRKLPGERTANEKIPWTENK